MKLETLRKTLKAGGILNLTGSPLIAFFYYFIEQMRNNPASYDALWLFSFFYCTFILGLLYIKAADDPGKYSSFVGVATIAKIWGIAAILYSLITEYYWILLVGVYDTIFLIFFILLYRQVKSKNNL